MNKRRVVVTGLGLITPVGNTVETSWQALLAGKSGIGLVTTFDTRDIPAKISGNIKDFDISPYMSIKDARRTDLFIQYGIAAASQAMEDSGLQITEENQVRIGVAAGSGIGGLPMIEASHDVYLQGGARKISPFFIPGSIINLLAGHISIKYGLQGPNIAIVTACTTGTHNIGQAARMIAYGEVDAMVCGGSEMATSPLGLAGFSAMRALSTRNDAPEKASRPWDRDHDGFVLGDGAGMMVLENYDHAKSRGARIYAELVGFGMSADASHITAPSGVGAQNCMVSTLQDGHLGVADVDYINAHGTSTSAGDKAESDAVKVVFKDYAYHLAVSSTKSMTGHLLGAAGAVEAVVSVLTIRDQIVPPTINLDNPEEGCDLNYVAHHAQERRVRVALSNSFGFGGTNGSLAFRAIE